MQATKPRRIYVQAFNPVTKKSRGVTLYNTDEDEVIDQIGKLAERKEQEQKKRAQLKSA